MNLRTAVYTIVLGLFILCSKTSIAQPMLPDIIGASDKGVNILSWMCQYDGIKTIAVQRSSDSVFNYATIGYVKSLKKGAQAYIDGHPNPGDNWYRLYIVFSSDLTWYSNRFKLEVDSAALMNKDVLPPNDSLQKYASTIEIDTKTIAVPAMNVSSEIDSTTLVVSKLSLNIPKSEDISEFTYIKSKYVFTNPFTGHVNMEFPEEKGHFYSIKFYNQKNEEVLSIPRIIDTKVVLDKRNFSKKGIYRFELEQDRKKIEEGHITIY